MASDVKSEESQLWMNKARSSLVAAEKLLAEGLFSESISRSYYAMFYTAKALLLSGGIDVSKHSAVISALGRDYVKTGKLDSRYHKLLIECFEKRQDADYDAYWIATEKDARKFYEGAKAFIIEVSRLL